jgi:hypothetical protein
MVEAPDEDDATNVPSGKVGHVNFAGSVGADQAAPAGASPAPAAIKDVAILASGRAASTSPQVGIVANLAASERRRDVAGSSPWMLVAGLTLAVATAALAGRLLPARRRARAR